MKYSLVIASLVSSSYQQGDEGRDCTSNLVNCPSPFYTNVVFYDDADCTVESTTIPPANAL